MTKLFVNYLCRRGRVYADVKDLMAFFGQYEGPDIPKAEILKSLRKWETRVMEHNE